MFAGVITNQIICQLKFKNPLGTYQFPYELKIGHHTRKLKDELSDEVLSKRQSSFSIAPISVRVTAEKIVNNRIETYRAEMLFNGEKTTVESLQSSREVMTEPLFIQVNKRLEVSLTCFNLDFP